MPNRFCSYMKPRTESSESTTRATSGIPTATRPIVRPRRVRRRERRRSAFRDLSILSTFPLMQRHSPTRIRQASSHCDKGQRQSAAPVRAANPLLLLQRSIGNLAVQRLFSAPVAHLQRQPEDPDALKEKAEADKARVEACVKQKT